MRIEIVGAGPAGLYAAILLKTLRSEAEIVVHEQNPADATFGFGVVFSDDALSFLRADDPQTADLIEPHMHRWDDIVVVHKGEKLVICGPSGSGKSTLIRCINRLEAHQQGSIVVGGIELTVLEETYQTKAQAGATEVPVRKPRRPLLSQILPQPRPQAPAPAQQTPAQQPPAAAPPPPVAPPSNGNDPSAEPSAPRRVANTG